MNPTNSFYFDHSPRGIPESMYILKQQSSDRSRRPSMKEYDASIIGHYEIAQGSPVVNKPVNVRKLPTSGPFSIAHNKIRNLLQHADDIDQDKVLEKLYLDCLELNKEAM